MFIRKTCATILNASVCFILGIFTMPVFALMSPGEGLSSLITFRFWLAVQELKKRPIREVPSRVEEIWQEFLAPGAPSAINLDSKSYDKTMQNVKDPGRYTFEDAQVSPDTFHVSLYLCLLVLTIAASPVLCGMMFYH